MFSSKNLQINRGSTTANAQGGDITTVIHTYKDVNVTIANIILSFPPYLDQGVAQDLIFVGDHILIEGSDTTTFNRILSLDPFTVSNNYFSNAAALSVGTPIVPVDGNGARLMNEILQLELADQTHPGILSAVAQNIGGNKIFHGNVDLQDPPLGITISKTMGNTGVQIITSDPAAYLGYAMESTAFPGESYGIVYNQTGIAGSGTPELAVLIADMPALLFNKSTTSATFSYNLISNTLDAESGQTLFIGAANATVINLGTNTTIPFDKELAVNQIDSVTAAPLILGATNTTEAHMNKGVKFATAGGTPSLLNYYELYDHVTTFTNNTETTAAITLKIVRIGDAIILRNITVASVPGQVAPTASFIANTQLPARFRPAVNCSGEFRVSNNAVFSSGAIEITTAGDINIYNNIDFTTPFTAAVANGFSTSTFSYTFN